MKKNANEEKTLLASESNKTSGSKGLAANTTCTHRLLEQAPQQALSLRVLKHKHPHIPGTIHIFQVPQLQLCPSAAIHLNTFMHLTQVHLKLFVRQGRVPSSSSFQMPSQPHLLQEDVPETQAGEKQVTNLQLKEGTAVSLWCVFQNDCMVLCSLVLTDTTDGAVHSFARLRPNLSTGHSSCNLPSVHKTCCTAGKPVMLQVRESSVPLACVKVNLQSTA